MELHKAIQTVLNDYGRGLIAEERLLNFLADYNAFENRATKRVLQVFLQLGYGRQVLELDRQNSPHKLQKISDIAYRLEQEGFSRSYVDSVLNSVCIALGWQIAAPTPTPTPNPIERNGAASNSQTFRAISNLQYTEMVFVEGGSFIMGSTDSEAYGDKKPKHTVTVSDFHIGKYEVTQQFWEWVMNYSGVCADGSMMRPYGKTWLGSSQPESKYGKWDYYPAYRVCYDDIVNVFLPRLRKITGKAYRLPTEAEWEYAARGGKKSKGYKYSGSNDIDEVAWYGSNSGSSAHPVGQKLPNELGIYDMSGNVWEWCSDWYGSYSSSSQTNPTGPSSGSYRVLRGGSWYLYARSCRVSYRDYYYPDYRGNYLGFRLACP